MQNYVTRNLTPCSSVENIQRLGRILISNENYSPTPKIEVVAFYESFEKTSRQFYGYIQEENILHRQNCENFGYHKFIFLTDKSLYCFLCNSGDVIQSFNSDLKVHVDIPKHNKICHCPFSHSQIFEEVGENSSISDF